MLKNQVVSSHIAGMLASQDLRIVIGALQMANILMTRLPQVFRVHFHREGVLHQVRQLADPDIPLGVSPPKCPSGNLFNNIFLNKKKKTWVYYLIFFLLGTLPSPQPGPSSTPVSSTANLSSSNATSPIASPTTNGNIMFGAVATSQMKPNVAATMETRSRTDLNVNMEDTSSTPPNAHL